VSEAFPVEVNGPANIVMLNNQLHKVISTLANLEEGGHNVYAQKQLATALKLVGSIDTDARKSINYIQALGRGERPAWHQIKEPQ
jgi:hypothetical protein